MNTDGEVLSWPDFFVEVRKFFIFKVSTGVWFWF